MNMWDPTGFTDQVERTERGGLPGLIKQKR